MRKFISNNVKFNIYKNNIIAYRDNKTGDWLTLEEYHNLLKEKPLNLEKIKNIQGFSENDGYYRFFKEQIEKKLARQLKMEL